MISKNVKYYIIVSAKAYLEPSWTSTTELSGEIFSQKSSNVDIRLDCKYTYVRIFMCY